MRATNKIYIPRILNFQFEIISALILEGNYLLNLTLSVVVVVVAILKIKQKIFQIRVMGM